MAERDVKGNVVPEKYKDLERRFLGIGEIVALLEQARSRKEGEMTGIQDPDKKVSGDLMLAKISGAIELGRLIRGEKGGEVSAIATVLMMEAWRPTIKGSGK